MILAETYTGLMTDGPHVAFEMTYSLGEGLLVYLIGKWLLPRWKDRFHREIDAHHGVEYETRQSKRAESRRIAREEEIRRKTVA